MSSLDLFQMRSNITADQFAAICQLSNLQTLSISSFAFDNQVCYTICICSHVPVFSHPLAFHLQSLGLSAKIEDGRHAPLALLEFDSAGLAPVDSPISSLP